MTTVTFLDNNDKDELDSRIKKIEQNFNLIDISDFVLKAINNYGVYSNSTIRACTPEEVFYEAGKKFKLHFNNSLFKITFRFYTAAEWSNVSGSTAPIFASNTYFIKNDTTYTLLTSEPSDWVTNYTSYYVNNIRRTSLYANITEDQILDFTAYPYFKILLTPTFSGNITEEHLQQIDFEILPVDVPQINLCVQQHNVGVFGYGVSGYDGDDVEAKISEWRAMLGKNQPDILLINEYSGFFDVDATYETRETLFNYLFPYNHLYQDDVQCGIFSKYPLIETKQVNLTTTQIGYTRRPLAIATTCINGVEIVLASCHLFPTTISETDALARADQLNILLNEIGDASHVIIGGDFNTEDDTTYQILTDAGFTWCNRAYFGSLITTPNGKCIDNIAVKGFTPYSVTCTPDDVCTSDHYPVVAKLQFKV